MPEQFTLTVNLHDVVIWVIVGLAAGALASRLMLGHGLGLVADLLVGVLGAVLGNWLAVFFGVQILVPGHPIISGIIVAFVGALILLLVLRLLGLRRHPRATA
jgi:uncharacterized membrane protein YeaQ/YmgE (transglycosylase-associated protein family)